MRIAAVMLACCLLSAPARGGGFGSGDCIGDCNGDGSVDVAEIIVGVRIALEEIPWDTCRNHSPPGSFGAIDGLVTSVRLALEGCAIERDYSRFERFEYGKSPALGFCPQPGLFSVGIAPAPGGHRLTRAHLVAGEPGVDACLPRTYDVTGGELPCPTLRVDAERLLADAELSALRAGFAAVPLTNSPDPFCTRGWIDPCVVTYLLWDGAGASDFPCSSRRLRSAALTDIEALLESLPADGSPVGACGNGQHDPGEFCDPGSRGVLACAPNCTEAAERHCILDPARSRLVLDAASGMPVDVALAGTQVLAVGGRRDRAVVGGDTLFRAGDVPIMVPSWGLGLAPIPSGDRCVCVSAAPVASSLSETPPVGVGQAECDELSYGSVLIGYRLAIGVLRDGGRCAPAPRGEDGACSIADYGPDCGPCTEDDAVRTVVGVGLGASVDCDDLLYGADAIDSAELFGTFPIGGGQGDLHLSCR